MKYEIAGRSQELLAILAKKPYKREVDIIRYVYPAVFTKEEVIGRSTVFRVFFPDLPGCITEGESIPNAVEMAREALSGFISAMQERSETIPVATPLDSVQCGDSFVSLVDLGEKTPRQ